MASKLLIVAPYTAGTPYAEEARELAEGAAEFGYRVEPIEIPDRGHWLLNVCVKPRYIRERWRRHDGRLLILDADCRILKPLDEMLSLVDDADVAIKYRRGYAFTALFNVGVILLGDTAPARQLVETWAERTERFGLFHRFPDQATFTEAILSLQRELRFRSLPLEFHVEPRDAEKVPQHARVIFHHKSSRAQRNANPQARPQPTPPLGLPEDVKFVALGPKLDSAAAGLPLGGWEGAKQDFLEYTTRFGAKKYSYLALPVQPQDRAALEYCRIFALSELARRLPADSRVVVADADVVFLHLPRPFYAPLAEADVVVAWDSARDDALPSTRVIGLRLSSAVVEQLLPSLEAAYGRLQPQLGPETAARRALATVLSSAPPSLCAIAMPGDTVRGMGEADLRTFAVSAQGEPVCCTGERVCKPPSFLRRPKTSPASRTFTG